MDNTKDDNRIEAQGLEQSLASIRSTIRKLEKADRTMVGTPAGTTLVHLRLDGLRVSLAALEGFPEEQRAIYSSERLKAAETVLTGLIPSLEQQLAKARPGSPQATLIRRRIAAFGLALEQIEERIRQIQSRTEQTP